ncbi:hypothetical protein [Mangrovimonas sp. TPBH4]|uniref:hypothetical protein n=1 Tax=Mangrovimonas sp. TPBH4 TaxID=1645914 RepID=UPI0012F78070|nr:hypothetical protein [Mangrovimonas sp. TPBH4]
MDDLLNSNGSVGIFLDFCKKCGKQIDVTDIDRMSFDEEPIKLNYKWYEISFKPYEDPEGVVAREMVAKEKEQEVEFYKDYLMPSIETVCRNEIGIIENRRKVECKYSVQEKLGYYNELESEYIEKISLIEEMEIYSFGIKELINSQILGVKDYLIERMLELSDEGEDVKKIEKIPFTISKENLAFLFAQFYEMGIIAKEDIKPSVIGRHLEKYFLFKGDREIPEKMGNRVSHYTHRKNWSPKNIQELKEILMKLQPR